MKSQLKSQVEVFVEILIKSAYESFHYVSSLERSNKSLSDMFSSNSQWKDKKEVSYSLSTTN